MMMPANFSAISENEMTYVNGGASLAEILAPELKVENWQKFNQNMVTIIGNSFLGDYVSNTVGTLFGGAYKPGNLGKAWFSGVSKYYNSGYDAVVGNGTDADHPPADVRHVASRRPRSRIAATATGSAAAVQRAYCRADGCRASSASISGASPRSRLIPVMSTKATPCAAHSACAAAL